ncbi:hypothetical protein K458DRAFT_315372 [Lentithecium fluviatile CBS 122367]|uniref:Uncharacterized protein n=1 Tax=Lentithecium fluviatile CBS 122367 TaxID=1168545 RepID=A0A6G1ILR0_9PLEO|nr:hypothetical protein K458DRAFT_315372 [Lentithecium fluviatile CBS 122367]
MLLLGALLAALPVVLSYPSAYNSINCIGDKILPTPTYGLSGANFSVCATINIKAPITVVSNAILDVNNYKNWNTFVYNATPPADVKTAADIKVGQSIVFNSRGIPAGATSVGTDIVTFVQRPYFAAWKNIENEAFIGHSEHCFLFAACADGSTQFTHWQTQYGLNAGVIYGLKPDFQRAYEVEANDLKKYAEKK